MAQQGEGDCFKVAYSFFMSGAIEQLMLDMGQPIILNEKSPFRLVHGTPVGTSGLIKGVRHWHGWVEVTYKSANVVGVFDFSNGHDYANVLRDDYYRIGQLDEKHVWRFTPKDARRAARRFKTYGPWVQGWQHMTNEDQLLAYMHTDERTT